VAARAQVGSASAPRPAGSGEDERSVDKGRSLDPESTANGALVDDEGTYLLADGLESFGITFIDTTLETSDTWDSTTLEQSSSLPGGVEIHVAMAGDELDEDLEPLVYTRRAVIRMRPLDFEKLLHPDSDGGTQDDEEEDKYAGKTLGDCLDFSSLNDLARTFLDSQSEQPFDASILEQLPPGARLKPECR